ncbi:hypothetical protein MRX96_015134 [Rhipicephalus microplus]
MRRIPDYCPFTVVNGPLRSYKRLETTTHEAKIRTFAATTSTWGVQCELRAVFFPETDVQSCAGRVVLQPMRRNQLIRGPVCSASVGCSNTWAKRNPAGVSGEPRTGKSAVVRAGASKPGLEGKATLRTPPPSLAENKWRAMRRQQSSGARAWGKEAAGDNRCLRSVVPPRCASDENAFVGARREETRARYSISVHHIPASLKMGATSSSRDFGLHK